MLTLPTNLENFIGRVFFLAINLAIGYLLVHFGLKLPNNDRVIFEITAFHFKFTATYIAYFLISTISFLALTILASLLAVNMVVVDTTNDVITFIALFNKQAISTIDIKEYFNTDHQNAFKSWEGLLIKTKNNKSIQVVGQNVKLLSGLKGYLIDRQIFCAGRKKMKFPFK